MQRGLVQDKRQMSNKMDLEKLRAAWNEFVNNENILPEVSPMVANSWRRCRAHINPTQKLQFNKLNPDHLLAAHVASFDLISIARPIMEDIYQNIDHLDAIIVLGNGTGYILDVIAEPGIVKRDENLENMLGVLFTEGHVGTNSLGLALIESLTIYALLLGFQLIKLLPSTSQMLAQIGMK